MAELERADSLTAPGVAPEEARSNCRPTAPLGGHGADECAALWLAGWPMSMAYPRTTAIRRRLHMPAVCRKRGRKMFRRCRGSGRRKATRSMHSARSP